MKIGLKVTEMKNLNWQPAPYLKANNVSPELIEWLSYPGSFMTRLEDHGVVNPKIIVLNETSKRPELDEMQWLEMKPRVFARIREVLICSDAGKWMVARTVIPLATLTGREKQLAHLKTRSLGSVLFKDPTVERTEFEYACVKPGMSLYTKCKAYENAPQYWARRSLFYVKEKPLLLTEVFLPGVEKL
ncbi:MAG: chorismate lyase [Gammaproteobacteria bacterium]|nr:chorismate lyase [Gammaproteobacteria bacterium]